MALLRKCTSLLLNRSFILTARQISIFPKLQLKESEQFIHV